MASRKRVLSSDSSPTFGPATPEMSWMSLSSGTTIPAVLVCCGLKIAVCSPPFERARMISSTSANATSASPLSRNAVAEISSAGRRELRANALLLEEPELLGHERRIEQHRLRRGQVVDDLLRPPAPPSSPHAAPPSSSSRRAGANSDEHGRQAEQPENLLTPLNIRATSFLIVGRERRPDVADSPYAQLLVRTGGSAARARYQARVMEPEDGCPLEPLHHSVQQEPEDHQHQDHRKRVRDRELAGELLHEHAEAALGGDELADHCADERQPGGGLQPGEHDRQRAGDHQARERLPPAGAERAEHLARVLVDREDGCQRVHVDGEERDDRRDPDLRAVAEACPGDDQRGDRDARRDLQRHRVRTRASGA